LLSNAKLALLRNAKLKGGIQMKTTEPIRDPGQVRNLTEFYLKQGHIRNYVLINMCVFTALRISDVLSIKTDDVYDFANNCVRKNLSITEKKTGKSKIIALNKNIVAALTAYLPQAVPGAPLILNKRTGNAISRIQAYRLIRSAAEALKFDKRVSCHSLRKTFGYHSWKGGMSPIVLMDIFNHSSLAVTQRYLGITQDDINNVYLSLDFTA
jgi:integrase